jgi:phosphoglycolate phosphatase-like HAD superfamily hydrolase/8-oxo-dGTP pyrophosphatase MutT (NUDIX family)
MIRNIVFDWSGTLMDDLPAVWEASNRVFREAGVPELTLEQFREEFSLPFTEFYDRFVPHIPLPQLEIWFHSHFKTIPQTGSEIPHARDFLAFCQRKKLRCFILSSVRRDHFDSQAKQAGFEPYFDRVYVEVMDKRQKILDVLAENGLDREETLFVGDMQHDIDAARQGGVHSCAVLTGYNRLDQLRASEPDVIVEHLGELQSILDKSGCEWRVDGHATADAGRPIVTVGALIYDDTGRVLMVHTQKWSHLWGIPGGKIKLGESSIDALRRELREETGLEVDRIEFVLAQDCIYSTEFYRRAHFVLLNYVSRRVGANPVVLNEEAQEYRWMEPREALKMPLNQPTRILLEAVLKRELPWA